MTKPMRILVTGGRGRIGRSVVRHLVEMGHEVTSVDVDYERLAGIKTFRVNLTETGEVYQSLARAEAEAVIHLGAWAGPNIVPPSRTYGDNVRGTYNVFKACADLGIRRVVLASTHHVYGFVRTTPLYVPVDEAHPMRPADPYALSKAACEQQADYFVDRHGLEIVSFRFMGVRPPEQMEAEVERVARGPDWKSYMFWTRMDARDAAVFCRLAVEAEQVMPGPYNLTGHDIVLREESAEMVRHYFPDRVEIREGLTDRRSPLSSKRAEDAFGYRSEHNWSVDLLAGVGTATRRPPEESGE